MGTRGFFAFCYKGKYYIVWNQCDSYPTGLGNNIVYEIRTAIANGTFGTKGKEEEKGSWIAKLIAAKKISYFRYHMSYVTTPRLEDNNPFGPSEADKKALAPWTDSKAYYAPGSWDELTAKCRGSPQKTLDSGYICLVNNYSDSNFEGGVKIEKEILYSSDVEYGYVINFDKWQLQLFDGSSGDFNRPTCAFSFDVLPDFVE